MGGNEDFDVTSSHWGLAAGLEAAFPMGPKMNLILSGGGEYFFSSRLTGHDTSYSPDNDNVNPRNDNKNDDTPFTYKDADKAISQPRFMPYAMIGLTLDL